MKYQGTARMKKNLILLLLFPILVFGFGSLVVKKIDTIEAPSGTLTLKNVVVVDNATPDSVPYFNPSKELVSSSISQVELEHLEGVTQNVQDAFETFKIDIQDNTDLIGTTSQDLQGQIDIATQDIQDNTDLIGTTSQDIQLQIDAATQDIADNTTLIGTTSQDIRTDLDLKADQTALDSATQDIATNTSDITGKVSLTGNETISGNKTFSGSSEFSNTGSLIVPRGAVGDREGSPVNGMFRYSTTDNTFEGYADNAWGPIAGAGGDFATTLLDNLGGAPIAGVASTYSAIPTGASSTVTITADNVGVIGDLITVTGEPAGAATLEGDFNVGSNDSIPYGLSAVRKSARIFLAPSSFSISKVDVYFRREGGHAGSNIHAEIQNTLQSGSFRPTGAVVSVSTNSVDSTGLSDSVPSFHSFTFDPPVSLTSGSYYAINLLSDGVGTAIRDTMGSNDTALSSIAKSCDPSSDCTNPANWTDTVYYPRFKIYSGGSGNKDVDTLIGDWNTLNSGNTATVNAGGTETPDIGETIFLSGGVDAIPGGDTQINAGLFPDTASAYDIGSTQSAWNIGVFETVLISDGAGGYEELSASVDLDLSAVTQNIVADIDNTKNIGSSSIEWSEGYFDSIFSSTVTSPNGQDLFIVTEPVSGNTDDITIQSGVAIIAGNSGDVNISTGAASGGTQGVVNITAPTINLTGNIPSIDSNKIEISSTTEGSAPCPVMTNAQMLAIATPTGGDCIYNSNDETQYNYNSTTSQWEILGVITNIENITDWKSFPVVATNYGTISSGQAYWRRVGDTMEVRGSFIAGTGAASVASLDLPVGYTIDFNKINSSSQNVLGTSFRSVGNNSFGPIGLEHTIHTDKVDADSVFFANGSSTASTFRFNIGNEWNNGEGNAFNFSVPISGWESSTKYASTSCEGLKCFNEFSAVLTGGNSSPIAIESQSHDWLSGCTRSTAGRYVCTFNTDHFSVKPSCTTSMGNSTFISSVQSLSTTSVTIDMWITSTGGYSDSVGTDIYIMCQRQGADFFDHDERFVEVNNQGSEHILYSGFTSKNGNGWALMPTEVKNTSDNLIDVTNTDHTRYTFKDNVTFTAVGQWAIGGLSGSIYLYHYNSSDVLLNNMQDYGTQVSDTTYTGQASIGDYIVLGMQYNVSNNSSQQFQVTARPTYTKAYIGSLEKVKAVVLTDQKTEGTNGGSSVNGMQTRDLNTVEGDSEIVSLSANQFTLQKGKYIIDYSAPTREVSYSQSAIYDVTNAVYKQWGGNQNATAAGGVSQTSSGQVVIEITVPTTYELRTYCDGAVASYGLGLVVASRSNNPNTNEIYSRVVITKTR